MPDEFDVWSGYDPIRRIDPIGARERALAELATRQHGVAATWQLLGLGFSRPAIKRRRAAGRLHRLYRGVFAVGHQRITLRGRWMAAVLACGRGAQLSHRCAGALRGLVERPSGLIEVTVPRPVRKRPGIRAFTATDLAPADRTVVDAIPCTSVARTLLGVAAVEPQALQGAVAQAEKRHLLDLTGLHSLIARFPRRPGAPALRRALAEHSVELEWTRSRLEDRFFSLCRRAGLERPDVNAFIAVSGWAGEVDFSWPELRLIVETDGYEGHGDRAAFEEDRRRDQHLVAAGWRVIRVTWRQVVYEPERVVETLGRLSARR